MHSFDADAIHGNGDAGYGLQAADALGVDARRVFKTLVAVVDGQPAVGIVPVTGSMSLKALAVALGAKRAEMCPVATAERVTGYVAGGMSPFGQKKRLRTVLDQSACEFTTIFVSGGKRGFDVEVAASVVVELLDAKLALLASS